MAAIPGIHLETLFNPRRYTIEQLDLACLVAAYLNRGKFVICIPPER